MTSPESREMRDTVETKETGVDTSASGFERETSTSGLQRERVLELISRFGLRRVEDIARAMRISEDDAEMLCANTAYEGEEND